MTETCEWAGFPFGINTVSLIGLGFLTLLFLRRAVSGERGKFRLEAPLERDVWRDAADD